MKPRRNIALLQKRIRRRQRQNDADYRRIARIEQRARRLERASQEAYLINLEFAEFEGAEFEYEEEL